MKVRTMCVTKTRRALVVLAVMLCTLLMHGCEDSEKYETVQGANERIRALEAENESLKRRLKETEAAITQRYKLKLSDAEAKLAPLRLELGAVQREKLALEERVDAGPRVERARAGRFMTERIVYLIMVGISLLLGALFGLRWKRTHDSLQHLVLQEVSELRRMESIK